jgi:predicted nucleic-acid-binding protein
VTGLDTNVLVRYLTLDDPEQARQATEVIETASGKESCLHVSDIALCELVWVLETAYGYGRAELTPVLERLLRTRQFSFRDKDVLWQALADYQRGKGDFSDYVLGRGARVAGCQHTVTFDSALRDSDLFRVL